MPIDRRAVAEAAARLEPRVESLLLTFYDSPRWLDDRWAVLGSDEGTELRVEADSAHVVSIDPDGELPMRFVNSTIEQLVHCIDAYRDYGVAVAAAHESAAPAIVEGLRRTLANIDPPAVTEPDAWWAIVLEQAADGLV